MIPTVFTTDPDALEARLREYRHRVFIERERYLTFCGDGIPSRTPADEPERHIDRVWAEVGDRQKKRRKP